MDFFSLSSAWASWLTIWRPISDLIKKYLKKSPIKKSLQNDISDIAEKWATDTDTELILMMHDKFKNLWVSTETENNLYDLWNSDNSGINDYFEKMFDKTMAKIEWFFYLLSKQIDWYESWLNLSSQLNNEKEIIVKQMDEDLWNFIDNEIVWIRDTFKFLPNLDEEINKWLETFLILKNFLLKKVEDLFDNIIWRFSKSWWDK